MSAGDLPVATSASSYQQLKSMLTLDLSTSETPAKKRRTMPFGFDYEKLQTQIISPLIASLQTVATPTPTKIFGPQDVSQAQAQYAQGFLDALSHVQRLNNFIPNNIPSPSLLNPLLTFSSTPTITTNPVTSTIAPPTSAANSKVKATSASSSSTSSTSSVPASAAAAVAAVVSAAAANAAAATSAAETVAAAAAAAAVTSTVPSASQPASVPEQSSSKEPPKVSETSAAPPPVSTSLPPPPAITSLPTSSASCAANDIVRYIEFINMQNNHHHADSTGGLMSPFLFPPVVPNTSNNAMLPHTKVFPSGMSNPNVLSPQFLNQIQPRECDMPSSSGASLGLNNMFPSMPGPMPPASMDDGSMDGASCSSSRSQEDLSFIGVDLDDQERKKLERKRARNRLAATKCRQRKLEKIQELEGLVSHERTRGANLLQDIDNLRKSITSLQNQLKHHKNQGCVLAIHDP